MRDLDVSLGGSEGAAGTMYRALVFTNTGGRTCTIQGFPGVSFVAGDGGRQVGEAAVRAGDKGGMVTLKPGGIASSTVGCAGKPPSNQLTVRTVHDGTDLG